MQRHSLSIRFDGQGLTARKATLTKDSLEMRPSGEQSLDRSRPNPVSGACQRRSWLACVLETRKRPGLDGGRDAVGRRISARWIGWMLGPIKKLEGYA